MKAKSKTQKPATVTRKSAQATSAKSKRAAPRKVVAPDTRQHPPVAPDVKEARIDAVKEAAEKFEARTGFRVKRAWGLEKPAETPAPANGSKPAPTGGTGVRKGILGHSLCAVVRALGKAGIKPVEAQQIIERAGLRMSPASLRVQLGFGRNPACWATRGGPAPLTVEQIEALRAPLAS